MRFNIFPVFLCCHKMHKKNKSSMMHNLVVYLFIIYLLFEYGIHM
jgi:hypothetical protein